MNSKIILTICSFFIVSTLLFSSERERIETPQLISLISSSKFAEVEELIEQELKVLQEESSQFQNPEMEEAKLYYALSFCYYWDEEEKVIEHLSRVIEKLSLIEDEESKKEISRFVTDFSIVYERILNFSRSRTYFSDRVDLYIRIFQLRAEIASRLQDIRLADRLKGELIQFETNITRDSYRQELQELHDSLDNILGRMERIPSIRG